METRERILWEALGLFAQKGFEAVSVRELAGAVGIRESSLYNHFKSKQDIFDGEDYSRSTDAVDGPFVIGLSIEKAVGEGTVSKAAIVSSEQIFTSAADKVVPGYNMKLFGSLVSSLAERESSVSVPVKYFDIGYLTFTARTVYVVGFVSIIVLPLGCLLIGLVIWLRRRRL